MMKMMKKKQGRYDLLGGSFFVAVLAFLLLAPSINALPLEMMEGDTAFIDGTHIWLKKADGNGYCRIKMESMKDQTIKVGNARQVGQLNIQVISASNKRCNLLINPQNNKIDFDITDSMALPDSFQPNPAGSELKTYQARGRTVILEMVSLAKDGEIEVIFVMRPESGIAEKTNELKKGSLFTFSDQSILALIDNADHKVKFGLRMGELQEKEQLSTEEPGKKESVLLEPQESATTEAEERHRKEELAESRRKRAEAEKKEMDAQDRLPLLPQREAERKCDLGFCYVNSEYNACLRPRMRMVLEGVPSYCDVDGQVKVQKEGNEPAQYSYECKSNVLQDQACLTLNHQQRFFNKVWKRFSTMFG